MKNKKLINLLLILMAIAVAVIIIGDFTGNPKGENLDNQYALDISEYTAIDSSEIIYKEIKKIKLNIAEPEGIDYFNGLYYVIADSSLIIINAGGQIVKQIELDAVPTAIAAGEKIFVAQTNRVVSFDQDGNEISQWADYDSRSVVTSIAASDSYVYVADAGNRVIYQCTHDGQLIQMIGEKDEQKDVPGFIIPSPYFDVDLDDTGFLWATDPGRHSLENFNADGSLRSSWTSTFSKVEGFTGCCNPSHMAILYDNSFVTSEKGVSRVKIYDQHGQYKGVVASPAMFDKVTEPADVCVDESGNVILLDFSRKQIRVFEPI